MSQGSFAELSRQITQLVSGSNPTFKNLAYIPPPFSGHGWTKEDGNMEPKRYDDNIIPKDLAYLVVGNDESESLLFFSVIGLYLPQPVSHIDSSSH